MTTRRPGRSRPFGAAAGVAVVVAGVALSACGDAGELGNGTTDSTTTPRPVTGLPSGVGVVSRVSAHAPVPVHVPSGVRFVTVSSGGYASYALDSSGRLWAWGENSQGQLGTGAGTSPATLPVDVGIHLVQVSSTAQNVAGLG